MAAGSVISGTSMRREQPRARHWRGRCGVKQWAVSAAAAALAVVLVQRPARAQSAPDLVPGEGPQPWPHVLPFMGKKAAERGINLQLPIGVGLNYLFMAQDVNIDRIALS